MTVLIDTNFLLAIVFPGDTHHRAARQAIRDLRQERIIPAPVLPELFYMVMTRVGYSSAVRAFRLLRTGAFRIEALIGDDMTRMEEIMVQYEDNRFDFVDVAIMTLAERLNITEIYTFDHRDFEVFRPKHCDYFELLP